MKFIKILIFSFIQYVFQIITIIIKKNWFLRNYRLMIETTGHIVFFHSRTACKKRIKNRDLVSCCSPCKTIINTCLLYLFYVLCFILYSQKHNIGICPNAGLGKYHVWKTLHHLLIIFSSSPDIYAEGRSNAQSCNRLIVMLHFM